MNKKTPDTIGYKAEKEHVESNCFGCGVKNPIGLHLTCTYAEDSVTAEIVIGKNFEGYPGVVHGGIVTTLLDEMMAKAVYVQANIRVATADLRLRFLSPARVEERLRLVASIRKVDGRKYYTSGRMEAGGKILAEAEGLFIGVGESLRSEKG
ncbi:MAG: PaaI family thioesterase [Peptococcaceae bacterium]|jgi:uncharacterized protein (TIGR00369 family)|nr:PaaI family thioesterase [Peptococcaceae bacterium]